MKPALPLKIIVFCNMTPSVLVEIYQLLDESTLSIFGLGKDIKAGVSSG